MYIYVHFPPHIIFNGLFLLSAAHRRVCAPVLGVAVTKRAHSRQSLVNQWLLAAAAGPDNAFDRNSIKVQLDAELVASASAIITSRTQRFAAESRSRANNNSTGKKHETSYGRERKQTQLPSKLMPI